MLGINARLAAGNVGSLSVLEPNCRQGMQGTTETQGLSLSRYITAPPGLLHVFQHQWACLGGASTPVSAPALIKWHFASHILLLLSGLG